MKADPTDLATRLDDANAVFAEMLRAPGRKAIKPVVTKSISTIDKWCQPLPSPDTPTADGIKNPLGCIDEIATHLERRYPEEARLMLEWLARRHDFYLIPITRTSPTGSTADTVSKTADASNAFADLLRATAKAIRDGHIDESESLACEAAFRRLVSEGQELIDHLHSAAPARRRK